MRNIRNWAKKEIWQKNDKTAAFFSSELGYYRDLSDFKCLKTLSIQNFYVSLYADCEIFRIKVNM